MAQWRPKVKSDRSIRFTFVIGYLTFNAGLHETAITLGILPLVIVLANINNCGSGS